MADFHESGNVLWASDLLNSLDSGLDIESLIFLRTRWLIRSSPTALFVTYVWITCAISSFVTIKVSIYESVSKRKGGKSAFSSLIVEIEAK